MTLGRLINHGLKGVAHYKDHKKYRARQCIHIPAKLKMLILEYIKEVKKKGDQPFYKTGEWKLKVPNELKWSFQKVSSSEASGSPYIVLQADKQTIPSFEASGSPDIGSLDIGPLADKQTISSSKASGSPDIGPQAHQQTSFGKAIIIWHIATDMCFYLDDCQQDHHNQDVCFCLDDGQQGMNLQARRKLSKILSDYMMYLLAMRPDMLSVATGDILFRGAHAQMKNFLEPKISTIRNKARLCRDLKEESVDEAFRRGVPKNNMLTSDWNIVHALRILKQCRRIVQLQMLV
ncbi:hypothetical protein Pint_14321 [Pistacia integerrima]|uniref:Uncharacterized protein n=1 Tax=Pistacia integerrima TaxID=434235 RepID=A0ACC0Y7X8_9ROSI|nr:hypothetical protein Pint_14321 [Pistacia integerrima]